jgi:cytidylate kinase
MTTVILAGGKYKVVLENGVNLRAKRRGEEWKDLSGADLIIALVQRIEELGGAVEDKPKKRKAGW